MPRKRHVEHSLIKGALGSFRPDLAGLGWVIIEGQPRAEAARLMAACDIFLSLSNREGLGLPPLEAMATGALVVGYHGDGGQEYATPENGDWFGDGSHVEIARMLGQRLDELAAGERFEARREAGRRTAAAFSQARFEAELAAAFLELAGPP
jgi:glycosyltransferase involved in cell wall biosynthesis